MSRFILLDRLAINQLLAAALMLTTAIAQSQTVYCSISERSGYTGENSRASSAEDYIVLIDAADGTVIFRRADGAVGGVMGSNKSGRLQFAMKATGRSLVFIAHYSDAFGYFEMSDGVNLSGYKKSLSGSGTWIVSGTCRK